jgi:hypothetical protein
MNGIVLLENSIPISLIESWQRTCTVLVDRPLSAAWWKMGEMTGEEFLDDLAPLMVDPGKIASQCN